MTTPHHHETRSFSYRRLCELADDVGARIRLARAADEWFITVTVPAGESTSAARSAGFVFPSIDELEKHAGWLIRWLVSTSRRPEPPPETLL